MDLIMNGCFTYSDGFWKPCWNLPWMCLKLQTPSHFIHEMNQTIPRNMHVHITKWEKMSWCTNKYLWKYTSSDYHAEIGKFHGTDVMSLWTQMNPWNFFNTRSSCWNWLYACWYLAHTAWPLCCTPLNVVVDCPLAYMFVCWLRWRTQIKTTANACLAPANRVYLTMKVIFKLISHCFHTRDRLCLALMLE